MLRRLKQKVKRLAASGPVTELYAALFPTKVKEFHELRFWRNRAKQGGLRNDHYERYYTTFFGFDRDFYQGKRILDIGCGPRGSLEWATMARERVGVDPLVPKYLKLGADRHQMTYVAAPSENIPFADEHFDVVCTFNSLDHVDNYESTKAELTRLVKPGGYLLIIVEVNHPPSKTEPIFLPWNFLDQFAADFEVLESSRYEIGDHNIYGQLRKNARFDDSDPTDREGIVTAKLRKRTVA